MRAVLLTLLLFLPWLACAPPADAPPVWEPYSQRCADVQADAVVLRCTSGAALGPWRAADGAQLAATVQASPAAAGVVAGRRWRGGHPDEMGAEEVTRCQAFKEARPTQSHSTTLRATR